MKDEMKIHAQNISKIAQEIMEVVEKYYPEIINKTYDNYGFPGRVGVPTLDRIGAIISIELLKAGAFGNDNNEKIF